MAVPENTREIAPERASDGFAFFSFEIGDDDERVTSHH